LVSVLVGGGAVVLIATAVLYLVFRKFSGKQAGSQRHFAIMAALVAFLFLCCFVLYVLSR
jgi:multisubunit Na+/H+ antiporter MnhB subunit